MTDQPPESETVAVGKPPDPPAASGRGLVSTTDLLLALWLVTLAALAVAPFLSFYGYRIVDTQNDELISDQSFNGWGVGSGVNEYLIGHGPRIGVVLVLLAVALSIAVVATVLRPTEAWPARLGALASAMTVAVGAAMLLDAEALKSTERFVDPVSFDVTLGLGLELVFAAAFVAAVAVVAGLHADRDRVADTQANAPTVPEE